MSEHGSPRPRRDSLSGQFRASLTLIVLALVLTALISLGTVLWATMTVSRSEDTVDALRSANRAVLQDMTNAETGIRGYGITSSPADLRVYELGVAELPTHRRELRELAAEYPRLNAAVATQDQAIATWFRDFARPELAGEFAAGRPETRAFSRGSQIFEDFRTANSEVHDEVDLVVEDLRGRSRAVIMAAMAVVAMLPMLAIIGVTVLARRLTRTVVRPLSEISAVLGRLRAGESGARASVTGPREIREIAHGLNLLTEENLRASEVEADVQAQLHTIDKVRHDLVSTVSHELRTPLTSITGYVELLHDELAEQLTPRQVSMLAAVERNLDRLDELIGNLLTLSRAEDTTLSPEPLDLRSLAAEVTADLQMHAASQGIALRTLLSASPVVVLGDRSQLSRAVLNLVSNAVKFSPAGSTVEVRVTREHREAVVEVVDEGIGIPAPDLPDLGARFFRASNAVHAEIGGTGLGLRIVQTILSRHQGNLSVESVEGEGSTFTIRLPVTRSSLALTADLDGDQGDQAESPTSG